MSFTARFLRRVPLLTFCLAALTFAANAALASDSEFELHFYPGQTARAENSPVFSFDSQVTVEAWIRFEGEQSRGHVLGKFDWDEYAAFVLSFDFGPDTGHLSFSVFDKWVTDPDPIPKGAWTHVAGTYDGSELRIYVDGILKSSRPVPAVSVSDDFRFQLGGEFGYGLHGTVRDVRIWSKAISARQVDRIAQGEDLVSKKDLRAHWPLDDGPGQIARGKYSAPDLTLGESLEREGREREPFWRLTDPVFKVSDGTRVEIVPSSGEPIGTMLSYAMTDWNRDGFADFIYSGPVGYGAVYDTEVPFRALLGTGNGAFQIGTASVFSSVRPTAVHARNMVIGDFNRDGSPDMFSANHGFDQEPLNGEPNTLYLSNLDGFLVESSGNIHALPCDRATPISAGQRPCNYVGGFEGGFVGIFPSPEGSGTLETGFTHTTASGDIDNDGDMDIYVGNIAAGLQKTPHFLVNDGSGRFEVNWDWVPRESFETYHDAHNYNVSKLIDVDADGNLDLYLASGEFPSSVGFPDSAIFWGNGTGDFSDVPSTTLPEVDGFNQHHHNPGFIDIDSDGDLDIVRTPFAYSTETFQSLYGGKAPLQVLVNNGRRQFVDESATRVWGQALRAQPLALVETDFNEDGCPDLLWQSEETPDIPYDELIWLNDCDGAFHPISNVVLGREGVLFPVDADLDGDLDFLSYSLAGSPKPGVDLSEYGETYAEFVVLERLRAYSERPNFGLLSSAGSDVGVITWNSGANLNWLQWIGIGTGVPEQPVRSGRSGMVAKDAINLPGIGSGDVGALASFMQDPNTNALRAYLHHQETGHALETVGFGRDLRYVQAVAVYSGSSYMLGVIGATLDGRGIGRLKDPFSGKSVSELKFSRSLKPVAGLALQNFGDSEADEVAMIGITSDGKTEAQIKDSGTGNRLASVQFGKDLSIVSVIELPDVFRDRSPEIALLSISTLDASVRVRIKEASSNATVGNFKFSQSLTPQALVYFPQYGQSSAIGVLGRSENGVTKLQLRELGTGRRLKSIRMAGSYRPKDIVVVSDANNNGYDEFAVLSFDGQSNGRVTVNDGLTGEIISKTNVN